MRTWQLQDAKAQFSEVIRKSSDEGPQCITKRGKPAAVVISSEEYKRLKSPLRGFVELMRESPLYGIQLDLNRKQTPTRDVDVA